VTRDEVGAPCFARDPSFEEANFQSNRLSQSDIQQDNPERLLYALGAIGLCGGIASLKTYQPLEMQSSHRPVTPESARNVDIGE